MREIIIEVEGKEIAFFSDEIAQFYFDGKWYGVPSEVNCPEFWEDIKWDKGEIEFLLPFDVWWNKVQKFIPKFIKTQSTTKLHEGWLTIDEGWCEVEYEPRLDTKVSEHYIEGESDIIYFH